MKTLLSILEMSLMLLLLHNRSRVASINTALKRFFTIRRKRERNEERLSLKDYAK